MANIKQLQINNTSYDIKDNVARTGLTDLIDIITQVKHAGAYVADGAAKKSLAIPFAKVDSTSTATAFTATVDGITELVDGTCVMLENGVVTSAAGFTININGLGAKPAFSNLTAATRDTTIFNVNYTMLFVYDSNRVVDSITGAWCCYRGYDANTNTIGYQLRSNSYSKAMTDVTYRYRLLFSSADNSKWVPANTSSSTDATTSRTVCQTPINPFGEIVYYSTTASVAAGSRPSATNLWQQYTLTLGYSFNRTGAALTLTSWKPVYVKCAPQADGSAIIDSTTPYVQALPSTDDGKIYIFLGVAYSATAIELLMNHPVFYYKDGAIRQWNNAAETDFVVDFVYDENEGDYVCSKTYSEITAALAANRKVVGVAKYNNTIQGIYSNVYTTGNSVYFVQLDEGESSSPEIFSFILSNADELTTSTHRLLQDTDSVIRGANNIWCSITIGSNDAVTVSNNPFTDFDSYIFGNEQSVILKASVTYNSASYSHDVLIHAKYTGTGAANRKYIGVTPLEYTNNKYLYLEFTNTTASGKVVEFYSKPSTGIPSTDLASAVQTSLGKADTSLQPDVANDLGQGTISASNSQGFDYIIADKDTSSEQTLQDALDAKANDSAVVHKTGNETIAGNKTFSGNAIFSDLDNVLIGNTSIGEIMEDTYAAKDEMAVTVSGNNTTITLNENLSTTVLNDIPDNIAYTEADSGEGEAYTGGYQLPAVTSEDSGKILSVSGGSWAKTENPSYLKTETYNKEEINNLIVSPESDVVVGTLPASGTANTIYRVPSTNSYSDYGWDGTQFVLLATYNNGIDDSPTQGSDNLVKSGGVYPIYKEVYGVSGDIEPPLGERMNGWYYNSPTLYSQTGGYHYIVDLAQYVGAQVVVEFDTTNTESNRATAIGNNTQFSEYYPEKNIANGIQDSFVFDITESYHILYISISANNVSNLSVVVTGYEEKGLAERVQDIELEVNGTAESQNLNISLDGVGIIYGSNKSIGQTYTGATDGSTSGIYNTTPFDISPYSNITLTSNASGNRAIILTNDDNKIVALGQWGNGSSWTFNVSSLGAKNLWVCVNNSSTNLTAVGEVKIKGLVERVEDLESVTSAKSVVYVSENGSDDNEGTGGSPLASINAALSMGAEVVYIDGIVNGQIDLSLCKGRELRILKKTNGNISVLHDSDAVIINNGTETLESGRVYKKVLSANISTAVKWIYQEFIDDTSTIIDAADRMPLQRGRVYRCKHTRITKTTAATVSAAISEIQGADDYRWFFDTSTKTLYFSRPQASSAEHPIITPKDNKKLFSATNKNIKLTMSGIDVIGMVVNAAGMDSPHFIECSCGCVCGGGGFVWNNTIGARYDRCEAFFVQYNDNGDGFNCHATFSAGVNVFERYCFAEIVDCWAHDIYDDGYSDHGRCEVSIFGGLFEYCGKGAITPSNGTHCTCYNVVARYSVRGFYCAGSDANEGGQYTQLKCISCASYGHHLQNNGGGHGFSVVTPYNRLIAINCAGWNNADRSYWCNADTYMMLVDCKSSGDTSSTPIYRGGEVEIINNSPVS